MSKKKNNRQDGFSRDVEKILNFLIWGGFSVALFFIPLFIGRGMFYPFVGPRSIYFMALVQVVFFSWVLLAFHVPKYRPKKSVSIFLFTAFILSAIASTFLGPDPVRSFWSTHERMGGLLMFLHLFAFFTVALSFFNKKKDWLILFAASCSSAVIVSAINFISILGIGDPGKVVSGSTLGNTSFMGTYLLLNVFLALYLSMNTAGGLKILSGSAFGIISLGLFYNERGRAALGAFLIGSVLIAILWLFFHKKGVLKYLAVISLVGFIIVGLFGAFINVFPDNNIATNILERSNLGTIGGRTIVGAKAWEGVKERPLLGWGPDNFELVFTRYYNPCMGTDYCGADIRYDRAHNFILDNLVFFGVIGFFLLMSIPIVILYGLWRNYIKQDGVDFWEASIFTAIITSYFVQNLTVFDTVTSYMMFFLVLAFGAFLLLKEDNDLADQERKLNIPVLVIVMIMFIFAFGNFVNKPLVASSHVGSITKYAQGTPERNQLINESLETSKLGRDQVRIYFSDFLVNFVDGEGMSTVLSDPTSRDYFYQSFEIMALELEASIEKSPLDYWSRLKLGQLYNAYYVALLTEPYLRGLDPSEEVTQKSEEILAMAEARLEEAIELSPTNQQTYWDLSQSKVYRGEFEEAFALTEKAVKLEPELLRAHLITVRIVDQLLLDEERAEEVAKRAIAVNPKWESMFEQYILSQ